MLLNGAMPVPVQIMKTSLSKGSFKTKTPCGPRSVSSVPIFTSSNKYGVPAPFVSNTITSSNTFVPSGQEAME